jgi:hypothetical protein
MTTQPPDGEADGPERPSTEAPPERGSGDRARIKKSTIAIAALFLTIPGLIPLYYATEAEQTQAIAMLVAMGVSVLVLNAVALFVLYRWLQRLASSGE